MYYIIFKTSKHRFKPAALVLCGFGKAEMLRTPRRLARLGERGGLLYEMEELRQVSVNVER